ncbi:hypothetical protein BJV78DRAFT_1351936 [Lactifluus subvellereus]|nr:hypothetical protein BJV78DRAFT_1351936 [Lactifluus subvellereus]
MAFRVVFSLPWSQIAASMARRIGYGSAEVHTNCTSVSLRQGKFPHSIARFSWLERKSSGLQYCSDIGEGPWPPGSWSWEDEATSSSNTTRVIVSPNNRTILPNRPAIPPSLTSAVVKVRDPRAGVMTTEPRDAAAAGSPRRPPSDPRVVSDPRLPRGKILRLMTSEEVPRYKKGITIRKKPTKSYKIEPLTIALPYLQEQSHSVQGQRSEDCRPWIPKTHPKGARYFFDRDRRLFTDTDMHNREFREEIEEFYYCLQKILIADQLTIPSNEYDLVLDIQVNGDGRKQWSYYYACHDSETRCLFWLHTCEAADIISRVYGVESPAHIKHRLEALYWSHWSHYPAFFEGRRLPISVCDKLIGMLSYGCADSMISNCPSLPVDIDKMQKMIEIVKNAKDNSNEAPSSLEYHIAGIVQFLSLFANWRFMDFHGQPHARLSSDQRVYHQQKHGLYGRSLGFTLLSLLFFLAPNNYLQDMEMLWTDGYITLPDWESFMNDLLQEWKDILVPSTVMLSVTVSYLAIPGTILSNLNTATFPSQVIIFTSPAQIASTLSIVASVGSIVIDLLLVRYTSTKPKPSSTSSSSVGIAYVVVRHSLPFKALLPTSIHGSLSHPRAVVNRIVLFFAALLLSSFAHSNTYTRISVVAMSGIVACLTVWSILTTWRWDHESPLALKRASDSSESDYPARVALSPLREAPAICKRGLEVMQCTTQENLVHAQHDILTTCGALHRGRRNKAQTTRTNVAFREGSESQVRQQYGTDMGSSQITRQKGPEASRKLPSEFTFFSSHSAAGSRIPTFRLHPAAWKHMQARGVEYKLIPVPGTRENAMSQMGDSTLW